MFGACELQNDVFTIMEVGVKAVNVPLETKWRVDHVITCFNFKMF